MDGCWRNRTTTLSNVCGVSHVNCSHSVLFWTRRRASTRSTRGHRWPRWPDSVWIRDSPRPWPWPSEPGSGSERRREPHSSVARCSRPRRPFVVLAARAIRRPARSRRPRPPVAQDLPRLAASVGNRGSAVKLPSGHGSSPRAHASRERCPRPDRRRSSRSTASRTGPDSSGRAIVCTKVSRAARNFSCRTRTSGHDAVIGKQLAPKDAQPPELVLLERARSS